MENSLVKMTKIKSHFYSKLCLLLKTDVLTLTVEKVDASTMKDGSFTTSGGGSFTIPGVDNLLAGKVGTDNAILDVQVIIADNTVRGFLLPAAYMLRNNCNNTISDDPSRRESILLGSVICKCLL